MDAQLATLRARDRSRGHVDTTNRLETDENTLLFVWVLI